MSAFRLFTIAGVPVSATPWFLLLLYMFANGSRSPVALCAGICIGIVVHELGHALVARYLRHNPSITLHGFGGLTHSEREGRDVERAAIIAMGPAAGLLLGLSVGGAWLVLLRVLSPEHAMLLLAPRAADAVRMFVWPSIAWNLLNLIPIWPLDGGQLFRLGVMRLFGARRADVATHVLSLVIIGWYLISRGSSMSTYWLLLPIMIAWQNVQALRGEVSSGLVHTPRLHTKGMLREARTSLSEGRYKEAARLAQQARSQSQLGASELDEVWEILGVSNTKLEEYEEALSYLKRARPSTGVREATEQCLVALEREDELAEIRARWQTGARGRYMGRVLVATLSFIAVSTALVFMTPLSWFL